MRQDRRYLASPVKLQRDHCTPGVYLSCLISMAVSVLAHTKLRRVALRASALHLYFTCSVLQGWIEAPASCSNFTNFILLPTNSVILLTVTPLTCHILVAASRLTFFEPLSLLPPNCLVLQSTLFVWVSNDGPRT